MSAGTAHRRILLVEDEAIIAMDEQRILESHEYDVDVVHSGEAALTAVAGDDGIELVLMDIDLGAGMDGTEATREILRVRDVPIVFLTSHTEKAMVDQVRGITSYGYVVKDSGEFVLVQSIEMAFRLFETTRELKNENAEHRATRASLDDSRRFLSSTLEAIQEGISVLDPSLVVRHVNDVMNRWYAANTPLVGKKCYAAYHGRSEPCPNCPTIRALDTGKTESSVVPGLPGSPVKWVELFAYPTKDPVSDEVTGVVEFVRDVTARAEYQRELRELSRRSAARSQYLEAVFAAVPDAVITLDLHHHVLEWSPGAEALFGYTPEEAKGRDIDELVSGPGGEALEEAREFTACVSSEQVMPPTAAVRYRKDGSPVDVLFSSAPITIDGRHEGTAAIYKDVSARRAAERATARSEERYRLLAENSLDVIALFDGAMTPVYISPSLERLTGYRPEHFDSHSVYDPVLEEDREPLRQHVEDAIARGQESSRLGYRIRRRDGRVIHVENIFRYLYDPNGKFDGMLLNQRDVTEQVEAEHQLEAERERAERLLEERNLLSRETQHRIKNDLALVRSLLSMQASRTADPESRSVLEEAASRVTVMASLHDKLFHHTEVETVSMEEFIDSLLAELRQASSFSGMNVSIEAEAFAVPARVSVGVGIMLNELLTNAIKHAQETRGHLDVRGRIGRREDGSLEILFRDTGAGFPDGVLSGEKRGLGLTIIEALARQHDGEVSFRNDGGAVVEVTLAPPTGARE